jgi:hypothetical protein
MTNNPTLPNELPPAIRAILCPATIAGEDPALAAEIFALVQQDWDPRSFREWTLVSQVANAELEFLRFGPVRKWVFDAAVARTILKQILDIHVEKEGGVFRAQYEPPVEQGYTQSWWREMKRMSFAAVSGDNDALQTIEAKIGPNKVRLGAETVEEFERTMASQVFLDRSLSAAVSRRDTACRELERLALRRSKTAAETPLEARGIKDVPLAPADAPIVPESFASVSGADSLDVPQSVSETAPVSVSVHSPRHTPADATPAQEASDTTPAQNASDETPRS